MDKDMPAALIPLAVVFFGMDWATGFPILHIIGTFLSQNGF